MEAYIFPYLSKTLFILPCFNKSTQNMSPEFKIINMNKPTKRPCISLNKKPFCYSKLHNKNVM